MAVAYVGADLVRGQFQAPSLRDYGNLDTQPINIGTAFESPPRFDDFSMKMIPAAVSEEWDMFAAQDNAMDAEIESGFLLSSNGKSIRCRRRKSYKFTGTRRSRWSSTRGR